MNPIPPPPWKDHISFIILSLKVIQSPADDLSICQMNAMVVWDMHMPRKKKKGRGTELYVPRIQ